MRRRTALVATAAVAMLSIWTAAPALHAAAADAGRPVPTLGLMTGLFSHGAVGFGKVRPKEVYNGGDPTGLVTSITWHNWGQARAVGTGRSDYVAPNQSVAAGTTEPVRIVAFDLGSCDGHYMYAAVEWYFPQHKQVFDASQFEDVCIGAYYPLETGPYQDGNHGYTLTVNGTPGSLRGSISSGTRVLFTFRGRAALDGSLTLVSNGPADAGHTVTGTWSSIALMLNNCRSYLTQAPSCTFYN
jgi:hypothetical protein